MQDTNSFLYGIETQMDTKITKFIVPFHSNSFQPPLSILVGLNDMEPKLIYPILAMINIVTKGILIS